MASFRDYLTSNTIIDLDYDKKEDALEDLAKRVCRKLKIKSHKSVIEEMIKREESASTFVGQGVAIPLSEATMSVDFGIIVGRSIEGINYDAARKGKAHIIVLVVSNNKTTEDDQQIELLAEISTFFKNKKINKLLIDDDVDSISELFKIVNKDDAEDEKDEDKPKKVRKEPLITAASNLAKDINASAIMIFADAKLDNEFLKYLKVRRKIIIVTSNKSRFDNENGKYEIIQTPSIRNAGQGQIRIGVLLAMSRSLLTMEDTIVCVSGIPNKDSFESVFIVDIDQEFQFIFNAARSIIPDDVEPEILERVLGLANEIGMEGREGKSLGTIFVLGDTNSVNRNITQLIINPFKGYSDSESNILDPGLEETIKEFASIDGAFIVTGQGVVKSAGSYLRPTINESAGDIIHELPSGLGSRHAAAAAITACTNSLSITVSESTGQVTVFKNGGIALTLSRPVANYEEE